TSPSEPGRVLDAIFDGTESGSGPVVEIELFNKGTLNKTGLMVDVSVRHLGRDLDLTRRFMIESLPANSSLSSTLTLRGLPRGRYQVTGITLVGSDVLGLFRARRKIFAQGVKKRRKLAPPPLPDPRATLRFYIALTSLGFAAFGVGLLAQNFTRFGGTAAIFGGALSVLVGISGLSSWWRSVRAMKVPRERTRIAWNEDAQDQLLVGPATVSAGRLAGAAAAEESGAEAVQFDVLGRGDELRGTRPYVAGDDLRTVHWKSTARLGRLVVKEFHRPARTQCTVIWDGASAATSATSSTQSSRKSGGVKAALDELEGAEGEARSVEMALSLAASLCRVWLERGLSCTLLALDDSGARLVLESGARSLTSSYVEALAEADAARTTSLALSLAPRLRDLPREGDVFLVTTQALETSENGSQLNADVRRAVAVLRSRGARVTVAVAVPPPHGKAGRTKATNATKANATNANETNAGQSSLQMGDEENKIQTFNDASGARVVVIAPPTETVGRRNRFATTVIEERRAQASARLVLEQNALSAALNTLMRFDGHSKGGSKGAGNAAQAFRQTNHNSDGASQNGRAAVSPSLNGYAPNGASGAASFNGHAGATNLAPKSAAAAAHDGDSQR
ncbi:MAG TPA: DUF58 domain-containing protein, partial [Abditibacteriaceae bacterium]|nr:DUF58 domain-containing protein [Abditibacteriaceae bacterium]